MQHVYFVVHVIVGALLYTGILLTVLKSVAKLLHSQYSRLTPHAFLKRNILSNNYK